MYNVLQHTAHLKTNACIHNTHVSHANANRGQLERIHYLIGAAVSPSAAHTCGAGKRQRVGRDSAESRSVPLFDPFDRPPLILHCTSI